MYIKSQIINGDCLNILPELPPATMIFADPPDNRGLKYKGFKDSWPNDEAYRWWLTDTIQACRPLGNIPTLWLSVDNKWSPAIWQIMARPRFATNTSVRQVIWHYTFGQNQVNDMANCFRPIFRMTGPCSLLYPNQARIPSARQAVYNDKRADPRGVIPGDVWEFPRVCGTFKERRKWIPTQHPEALVERCVKFSCDLSRPDSQLVIDPFLGSGTTMRVCQKLGIPCIGIDISDYHCMKVSEETGVPITYATTKEHVKEDEHREP